MQSTLSYQKLCHALNVGYGRNPTPRISCHIRITDKEDDTFNQLCGDYTLSRDDAIEQLQLLLLWYMQKQPSKAEPSAIELIGHLIVNPKEINSWCTRCLELTEQIQYNFDSLVGTMCMRESRTQNTQELLTYHADYRGKPYSDTDIAHRISASFWVSGIRNMIARPPREEKEIGLPYVPNEDIREKLRKTFTRSGLTQLGLDKFLFRGIDGNASEYAFSYFLKSVLSLYRHKAFANSGDLVRDLDSLHLLYLQLLERVLALYSRLEAQAVRIQKFRDLMCEATGSAQLTIDEGLPTK